MNVGQKCHMSGAWFTGQLVWFPSKDLPAMTECGFESWLRLECSGFGMWHFLKLVVMAFLGCCGFLPFFVGYRLAGQVVKASASGAEDPGFVFRL